MTIGLPPVSEKFSIIDMDGVEWGQAWTKEVAFMRLRQLAEGYADVEEKLRVVRYVLEGELNE